MKFHAVITENDQVSSNQVAADFIRVALVRSAVRVRVDIFDNQVVAANDLVLVSLLCIPRSWRCENLFPRRQKPCHVTAATVERHLVAFECGHVSGSYTTILRICRLYQHGRHWTHEDRK